jgi:hypothetical protein
MAGKRGSTFLKESQGIRIHVFHDVPVDSDTRPLAHDYQNFGRIFTAEELCMDVARQLDIGSLAYHLFALQTIPEKASDTPVWLPANEQIECNEDECLHLQFRLRFLPPPDKMRLIASRVDEMAFNYFFLQCRQDFVDDRVKFKEGKLPQDKALGLAITDIVRFAKEHSITYISKRLSPRLFIPNSEKSAFKNIFGKMKLNLNFNPHIEKEMEDCEKMPLVQVKLRYIYDGLLVYAPNYCMEEYIAESGDILRIQPHNEKHPGLNIIDRNATGEAVSFA